jgi:hypothetical protein
MNTLPQLSEIDRELTETQKTTRNFEALRCGELFCECRVVQYRPGDSHLQVTVSRQSDQEKHGLQQALQHGDFREYHRRAALLRHPKTVTLVGHRPLKLPPEVEARRRADGEDPETFKALILRARHQREHERLSSWKTGRSPEPPFGHQKFDVPLLASVHEAAVAIGLPLAQEELLADETVKPLLMTAMGVPASLVDGVWERLKLHFSDAQHPLSLQAYIKRLVSEQRPPEGEVVFQDDSGEEYWTVQRAAQELQQQIRQEREQCPGGLKPRLLKTNEATIYRWIKHDGFPTKEFSYKASSGVRKTVKAVARADIECVKTTHLLDEGVIILLCKAHDITRLSAERQYRRICRRLGIRAGASLKPDEQKEVILAVLKADPNVVRYQELQEKKRPKMAQEDGQEEPGEALKAAHTGSDLQVESPDE